MSRTTRNRRPTSSSVVCGDDDDNRGTRLAANGRPQFDLLRSKRGALAVGSPQEVIDKILFQHELFGHQRFLAQMSVGAMPHAKVMRAIELLGTEVAPVVRRATAAA
jgi:alkanesulfonate monooxygenase SsuD/methylene tetrahydromethanopterin reductase-like flavin-dependent oxidoreductase (luciferase family)